MSEVSISDSSQNPIEKWNEKIKEASKLGNHKKLAEFHAAYRNEEAKKKYENLIFTNTLEAVVNTNFKVPSVTVSVSSFDKSKEILGLFRNAARNKILIEQYLESNEFKLEVSKCIVDSKIGDWGLMEIKRDRSKNSRLGFKLARISQFDLVIDPDCTKHDFSDARWIAKQFVKHKDVLAKKDFLKNNKNLEGNYNPKIDDPEFIKRKLVEPLQSHQRSHFADLVRGWILWDRDKKEKLVLVDSKKEALFKGDWDVDLMPFPIIPLWYYFNPDRPRPISPAVNIRIIEDEVNDLKHFQMNHARKVARTVWFTRKGIFSNQTKRLLEESDRDTIAEVKKGSPVDSVVQLKEKGVGFEYNQAIQMAKSGLSSLGQGFTDSRDFTTAAEPNIIASNAQKIAAFEAQRVEEFSSRILTEFLKLVQTKVRGFVIPLNQNDYIDALRRNRQILVSQPMDKNEAQLFIGGSISLEAIAAKDADGKFIIQEGKMIVSLPFVEINSDLIKGDFKVVSDRGSMQLETLGLTTNLYSLFKEDRFINQAALRKLVLRSFENSEVIGLQRPEQDVLAEVERNRQEELAAPIKEAQLKTQTDLKKTQMKTQSAEKIADQKILAGFIGPAGEKKESSSGKGK